MRRKLLGFLGIAILGFALGAGTKLLLTLYPLVPDKPAQTAATQAQADAGETPDAQTPGEGTDSQPAQPEENSVSQEQQPAETKTIIPEANPDEKEIVVEGMVDNISSKYRTIRFSQEIDDTTKKVNPRVKVLQDAIIEINGKQSSFQQIMVGDYVTMILNSSQRARAIQIKR
ncbi:MAG TPA: hypothetical protein VHS59_00515 [Bacillota bacterium]|nr:hypothetical protein [Bacillota bacterium]